MGENCVVRATENSLIVITEGMSDSGKMGVLKKDSNEWLINPEYNYVDYYNQEGVYMTIKLDEEKRDKFSFFNRDGKQISKNEYDMAYGYILGVCVVEKDSKLNVIDQKGNELLDNGAESVSYPIIENNGEGYRFILSVAYDISDGEDSEFIIYEITKDSHLIKL